MSRSHWLTTLRNCFKTVVSGSSKGKRRRTFAEFPAVAAQVLEARELLSGVIDSVSTGGGIILPIEFPKKSPIPTPTPTPTPRPAPTPTPTGSSVIVVTTANDVMNSVDRLTSLREAIAQAAATPGADVIEFGNGASLGGTDFTDAKPDVINLTLGTLTISQDVTISGRGADLLSINGNQSARVFQIQEGTVALNDLTVTGGLATNSDGGGIWNGGTLTLSRSTVSGNSARYQGNSSAHVGGYGGGIFNQGTMVLNQCTINDNQSFCQNPSVPRKHDQSFLSNGMGGGIYNQGTMTVCQSTIYGNSADSNGGGICSVSAMTVRQSTVCANSSGQSGGGIYSSDLAIQPANRLYNTVVAGNFATTSADLGGTAKFGAYNLIGVGNATSDFSKGSSSNIVGVRASSIFATDTIGRPVLANNGGRTKTVMLVLGSKAIGAGSVTEAIDASGRPLTTDQRGVVRVKGGKVDIGATQYY